MAPGASLLPLAPDRSLRGALKELFDTAERILHGFVIEAPLPCELTAGCRREGVTIAVDGFVWCGECGPEVPA